LVGVYALDAHYSGDAKNQPSDSGVQTTVLTGSTTVQVAGTNGNTTQPVTLGVTVN
jgi:hypothetical protein